MREFHFKPTLSLLFGILSIIKEIVSINQKDQRLASSGKICSLIGLGINFFYFLPIVWFAIAGF
ncbi:hypothetical protein LCY76_02435 [Fictibacillus sp. KIGAM418]|uniref:Uncharacterized protein n=1 Tax=Fictibacillus marinisediminis TaxID=2878389 RepID=A0A9X1X7H9_9BACL|nr:hypothetical protein [Fictibacillus marinisediminis]MCK6255482.1 hypothetical protein [Fictibacillus marinisediminis]